jgi:N utilization substance protein B
VLYALDLGETGPRDAAAARAAKEADEARSSGGPGSRAAPYSGRPSQTSFRAERRADEKASGQSVPPPSPPDDAAGGAELDPVEASGAAFDRITEHFSVPGAAIAFARELVAGVAARSAELDLLVGAHARNWRVSRMAAVDRNVLRLAVYELCETDTPVAVVIDEAVDLARRFGSDTSASFVNGILDAVAREVRAA